MTSTISVRANRATVAMEKKLREIVGMTVERMASVVLYRSGSHPNRNPMK